jgi:hypothetical protein
MRFFEMVPPERFDRIITGEDVTTPFEQAYGTQVIDESAGEMNDEQIASRLYQHAVRLAFEVGKAADKSRFLADVSLYTDGAHRYAVRLLTFDPVLVEQELA